MTFAESGPKGPSSGGRGAGDEQRYGKKKEGQTAGSSYEGGLASSPGSAQPGGRGVVGWSIVTYCCITNNHKTEQLKTTNMHHRIWFLGIAQMAVVVQALSRLKSCCCPEQWSLKV